jgi:hypothetical protein
MADRSRAIAQWVNANTRPNELVATEYDAMVYLYTGRETVPIGGLIPRDQAESEARQTARASLHSLLQSYPVRWLIPVTTIGFHASSDLARDPQAGVAFRTMLPVGAVFERVMLQQASADR